MNPESPGQTVSPNRHIFAGLGHNVTISGSITLDGNSTGGGVFVGRGGDERVLPGGAFSSGEVGRNNGITFRNIVAPQHGELIQAGHPAFQGTRIWVSAALSHGSAVLRPNTQMQNVGGVGLATSAQWVIGYNYRIPPVLVPSSWEVVTLLGFGNPMPNWLRSHPGAMLFGGNALELHGMLPPPTQPLPPPTPTPHNVYILHFWDISQQELYEKSSDQLNPPASGTGRNGDRYIYQRMSGQRVTSDAGQVRTEFIPTDFVPEGRQNLTAVKYEIQPGYPELGAYETAWPGEGYININEGPIGWGFTMPARNVVIHVYWQTDEVDETFVPVEPIRIPVFVDHFEIEHDDITDRIRQINIRQYRVGFLIRNIEQKYINGIPQDVFNVVSEVLDVSIDAPYNFYSPDYDDNFITAYGPLEFAQWEAAVRFYGLGDAVGYEFNHALTEAGNGLEFSTFPTGVDYIVIDALWSIYLDETTIPDKIEIPVYVDHFEVSYGTTNRLRDGDTINIGRWHVGDLTRTSVQTLINGIPSGEPEVTYVLDVSIDAQYNFDSGYADNFITSYGALLFAQWEAAVRFYGAGDAVGYEFDYSLTEAGNSVEFGAFPTGVDYIVIDALWSIELEETFVPIEPIIIPVFVDHFEVEYDDITDRIRQINEDRYSVGNLIRNIEQKHINGIPQNYFNVVSEVLYVAVNALNNFHEAYEYRFETVEFVQWEPTTAIRFYDENNESVIPYPITSVAFSNNTLTTAGHNVVFGAFPTNVDHIVIDALWSVEPVVTLTPSPIRIYVDHFQIDANYNRIPVDSRISGGFFALGTLNYPVNFMPVNAANNRRAVDLTNFTARNVSFVQWDSSIVRFFDESGNALGSAAGAVSLASQSAFVVINFGLLPEGTDYIVIDALWRFTPSTITEPPTNPPTIPTDPAEPAEPTIPTNPLVPADPGPAPVTFAPGLPSPSAPAPFALSEEVNSEEDEPAPPLFAPIIPNFPQAEDEDDEPGPPLQAPPPPNPQTGDDQSFIGFIASASGLGLSMAALFFALITKRKK
ncbi:MAG: hypothetical protein FWE24_08125 [Defluviitaleaceae bacterium]|nr:hypothetical protein [Defluviitaleaceae bacterium]